MGTSNRPLSPHLQVYRWEITMVLSILHRTSGVFLSVGCIVLSWWLVAAAVGPGYFEWVNDLFAHPLGQLAMLAWTAAFYYHLVNGVRHMLWDVGWGLEIPQVYFTGWSTVVIATVLTVVTWLPVLRSLL